MFWNRGVLGLRVLMWACLCGCGPDAVKRACVGGSAGSLVSDSAAMRLDVYGAAGHCVGGQLAAGAGQPIVSHSYAKGEAIKLDVPPGPHALVLSTYADAGGSMLLGRGCLETTLQAGSQVCFDLLVGAPIGDGGGGDMPECSSAAECMLPGSIKDSCVAGHCAIGSCSAGRYDCDGVAANGCEATGPPGGGPGCCTGSAPSVSGSAMVAHDNGVGGTYFDCFPLGTPGVASSYNMTMALDAAASDSAQAGTASGGWTCAGVTSICKTAAANGKSGTCTCWGYASDGSAAAAALVGHVDVSSSGGCLCLVSSDPLWH